ncbi:MAG: hypothetical protein FH758_13010 [Firmicutes bacterium]|nr:hypothetical protein [Bacillota bacterium]
MLDIFNSIIDDIKLVEKKIEKELIITKAGPAGKFAHLQFSHVDRIMRPAVTIFSARLFNYQREQTVVLASIIQFIYMASRVHSHLTEEDPRYNQSVDLRDGSQFPVLIGDYLYGKFFYQLSNANMVEHLGKLSDAICKINEGGVLRNQNSNPSHNLMLNIIQKETAELFAICCSLGAEISGASQKEKNLMHDFGVNFGLGYGMLEKGISYDYAEEHFINAKECLEKLKAGTNREGLFNLINAFKNDQFGLQRMVV